MKDQLVTFASFKVLNAEPLPECTICISNGVVRPYKKSGIFKRIQNALKFSIYCHLELPTSARMNSWQSDSSAACRQGANGRLRHKEYPSHHH